MVFKDGDELTCMFFLIQGDTGYVLPEYNNLRYVIIDEGCHFGITDIFGSLLEIFPNLMEMSDDEFKDLTES